MARADTAPSAWILTDGKAGDEAQCLGVTERLGLRAERRRVSPRPPFVWAMPWGPIDPAEAAGRPGSPIAPPWPDLLVASGRRTIPYVRAVRRLSGGRTFTAILKDPRTGAGAADLIWVPEHDRLRGPNVLATLTGPHRWSPSVLAAARADPVEPVARLPRPWAAVLVGGPSRHAPFRADEARRFLEHLRGLVAEGVSLAVTPSRRTPPELAAILRELTRQTGGFCWDGEGDNPLPSVLAGADAIVVTADSVNMVGEALATGTPVLVFDLPGLSSRHRRFGAELRTRGLVRPFDGRLERYGYEPLDATDLIADAVRSGLDRHRSRLPSLNLAGVIPT